MSRILALTPTRLIMWIVVDEKVLDAARLARSSRKILGKVGGRCLARNVCVAL